jgi:Putative F0F1-ATPase subunit Ca2+/Mg2+ transporter
MLQRDFKRKLYSGYADSMTRAFELVVAPLVFGLVGFGLDRAFGLTPILTIIAVVIAFGGTGVKFWYGYDQEMRAHDVGAPWTTRVGEASSNGTAK